MMNTFLGITHSWAFAFLAAAGIWSCADASSDTTPVQVDEKSLKVFTGPETAAGFPAISADRKKVAILRTNDAMGYSSTVDIFAPPGQARIKRFVLLSEREGEYGIEDMPAGELQERLDSVNEYLTGGRFAPMHQLYSLPDYGKPPMGGKAWATSDSGLTIAYEYQSSALAISDMATGASLKKVHRPLFQDGNPENNCFLQGIPVTGWIDQQARVLVFQIIYIGASDSCYWPDEWIVERYTLRNAAAG